MYMLHPSVPSLPDHSRRTAVVMTEGGHSLYDAVTLICGTTAAQIEDRRVSVSQSESE